MKRRTWVLAGASLLLVALVIATVGSVLAWGPGGMMGGYGPGPTGSGYGPGSSGDGYGPGGMMGGGYGSGYGYGPGGMMGGGYSYGSGPGGSAPGWAQGSSTQSTISIDRAQQDVQAYVNQIGNPDLTISEVMEFQDNFYAVVKEKSTGIGAFEVLINKASGAATWEPQSMMWNTKYGMMSGSGWMGQGSGYAQPSGAMTVSADQARQLGQTWLDQNQPGSTTEATPDTFYGYYTMHTLQNGQITGMLSVNGYTGQVWYHPWHGAYIQMKSLDG